MFKAPIRILIVAALCVAALIGLVVREGVARDSGQEIVLAMAPIDPRSLLSGHYVIVSLQEILPPGAPCPWLTQDDSGVWIHTGRPNNWIAFSPNGDRHSVTGSAKTRAEAMQSGAIVARGEAFCAVPPESNDPSQMRVTIFTQLGVDRFHINQAEAERIEHLLRDQSPEDEARVFAIVSIGADGRARLKGVRVDGERLMLDWF